MSTRYAVILLSRAEQQLTALYRHISDTANATRAERFINEILTACTALDIFPARGTRRDDIRPALRILGYRKRVTIAFEVDDLRRQVVIHGIFYGGQNYEAILSETEP